jgi:hypothetical protein
MVTGVVDPARSENFGRRAAGSIAKSLQDLVAAISEHFSSAFFGQAKMTRACS